MSQSSNNSKKIEHYDEEIILEKIREQSDQLFNQYKDDMISYDCSIDKVKFIIMYKSKHQNN